MQYNRGLEGNSCTFHFSCKTERVGIYLTGTRKDFYAHVNQEAFTKIISNLLNNGMKYAESYVHVMLEIPETDDDNLFRIRTVNDGVIIPDEMKEEILNLLFVSMSKRMER